MNPHEQNHISNTYGFSLLELYMPPNGWKFILCEFSWNRRFGSLLCVGWVNDIGPVFEFFWSGLWRNRLP